MSSPDTHTALVKSLAFSLGFAECGIAKAERLDEDARRLEAWLNKGRHAGMQYMENHFDLRIDPTKLVPGAKSVITLLFNYYPAETQKSDAPKIAKYAWGEDYHEVIREKLKLFLFRLHETVGDVNGRGFVDSAPVLERAWAQKSGLGWVGKNGNLINKEKGSFYFLATLIIDLELIADNPFMRDYCGTCTKCIDNCPTDAILPNKEIDAGKCISYFTIELKDEIIPSEFQNKFQNWMFGCDICQDVCPWNRFSKPHEEPRFQPLKEITSFTINDWLSLDEEKFKILFKDSPLKRAKLKGIKRNLKFLLHESSGTETPPDR